MKKLYIPFLAAFIFIFESMFVNLFIGDLINSERIIVPRFLMIFFVFLAVYSYHRTALWYSLIIGVVFDIVHTGILGIYLSVFPVITYIVSKTMKILQNNIFIVSIVSLVAVALLEVVIAAANFILGLSDMTFQEFSTIRLLPTLALNLIAVIIFAYPFKLVITKYADDESNEMLFRKRS